MGDGVSGVRRGRAGGHPDCAWPFPPCRSPVGRGGTRGAGGPGGAVHADAVGGAASGGCAPGAGVRAGGGATAVDLDRLSPVAGVDQWHQRRFGQPEGAPPSSTHSPNPTSRHCCTNTPSHQPAGNPTTQEGPAASVQRTACQRPGTTRRPTGDPLGSARPLSTAACRLSLKAAAQPIFQADA